MPEIRGRTATGRPVTYSLSDAITGRTIHRVETQVLSADGPATELEFVGGDLCRLLAERCDPARSPIGARARIRFVVLPAGRRSRILTPSALAFGVRHFAAGDGSEDQRVLSEFLVGRTITGLDAGGLTDEGLSITRLRLDTGASALVWPMPDGLLWRPTWLCLPQGAAPADPRFILAGAGFLGARGDT